MTYVSTISTASLNSNKSLKFYSVEVITFDQISHYAEVEARSAEEAQELAAAEFDDADYIMVHGYCEA